MNDRAAGLREQILRLVAEYHEAVFAPAPFAPGETPVPISGKVFDASEMQLLVDSGLDFWLTTGRFAEQFEQEFAHFFGMRDALLVNSGSSANLLALSALTSPEAARAPPAARRRGDHCRRRLPDHRQSDHAERAGARFSSMCTCRPTTSTSRSSKRRCRRRTRAIMIAHTLGNPFDLDAVTAFARQHGLWLIEDCCDAVGSTYRRPARSARSATCATSASIPRTTSRWAKAAAC